MLQEQTASPNSQVRQLADEKRFDYLVIESTGISEPLPVAETFTFADSSGRVLSDVASLDTLVTVCASAIAQLGTTHSNGILQVVDAFNFSSQLDSVESLKEKGMQAGPDDSRTIVDLLVDQIEFANVILVNKTDLVDEATLKKVIGTVKRLNPTAEVVPTKRSNVPLSMILNTGRFNLKEAEAAPGWLKELRGEHVPETEEYGISSFTFLSRRPFHPARLHAALGDGPAGSTPLLASVVRSKGFVWLATRQSRGGLWEHAGKQHRIVQGGPWYAAVPYAMWPATWRDMSLPWLPAPVGDRHNRIVIIGSTMDKDTVSTLEIKQQKCATASPRHIETLPFSAQITSTLQACVLSDEEWGAGPTAWAAFEDPFPRWEDYQGPVADGDVPSSMAKIINANVAQKNKEAAAAREASKAKFEAQRAKAAELRARGDSS